MTISERVKALNFPLGEYVVVGGAMEAHGIRPAYDVDIVVTEKLFEILIADGWEVCNCERCIEDHARGSKKQMLKKDGVDILSEYSCGDSYKVNTAMLIKNADIIDGVPYVQLEELLRWKKAAAREKDLKDVVLLEEYLKSKESIGNIAFIDGQNLHLGTKESGWSVDHKKLRIYLRDKYKITEAYYFLGFVSDGHQELYDGLQRAGFILSFREHSSALRGNKKGNVDSDIVFGIMKKLVENEPFGKAFIVSGDGDYKKLVDFLIKKSRFGKMLFPNRAFASSLYKSLGGEYFDHLDQKDIRAKIEYRPK